MTREAIKEALAEAEIESAIVSEQDLSGGCIHQVRRVSLADGKTFVVKMNHANRGHLFEEEAAGLRALASTDTVLVPEPLWVGVQGAKAILLMTDVPAAPASDDAGRSLGSDLAALHRCDVGPSYGYDHDNHIGATMQINSRCDDWVEFMARHRLGFQMELAQRADLLRENEISRLNQVVDHLDEFLPDRPRPSLLHGDLWSGNALSTIDPDGTRRMAIIDPAVSIGDGWADIAMMKLFGGFSSSCFDAYASKIDEPERLNSRLDVYQLYHVLNHVNLFGRGYIGQAMALVARLMG